MTRAPAAAGSRGAVVSAPAVVGGFGGNAGTPAAAGSSGAAFQAASSAVRPPPAIAFASDDHEDYQVRRMLVNSCFCAVILASVFTVLAFRYCVTHQRGGRILSILGIRSFLATRFYYCYIIFYYVWAEPRPVVLLSKIMGGGL